MSSCGNHDCAGAHGACNIAPPVLSAKQTSIAVLAANAASALGPPAPQGQIALQDAAVIEQAVEAHVQRVAEQGAAQGVLPPAFVDAVRIAVVNVGKRWCQNCNAYHGHGSDITW
jgi:hypothetical protein